MISLAETVQKTKKGSSVLKDYCKRRASYSKQEEHGSGRALERHHSSPTLNDALWRALSMPKQPQHKDPLEGCFSIDFMLDILDSSAGQEQVTVDPVIYWVRNSADHSETSEPVIYWVRSATGSKSATANLDTPMRTRSPTKGQSVTHPNLLFGSKPSLNLLEDDSENDHEEEPPVQFLIRKSSTRSLQSTTSACPSLVIGTGSYHHVNEASATPAPPKMRRNTSGSFIPPPSYYSSSWFKEDHQRGMHKSTSTRSLPALLCSKGSDHEPSHASRMSKSTSSSSLPALCSDHEQTNAGHDSSSRLDLTNASASTREAEKDDRQSRRDKRRRHGVTRGRGRSPGSSLLNLSSSSLSSNEATKSSSSSLTTTTTAVPSLTRSGSSTNCIQEQNSAPPSTTKSIPRNSSFSHLPSADECAPTKITRNRSFSHLPTDGCAPTTNRKERRRSSRRGISRSPSGKDLAGSLDMLKRRTSWSGLPQSLNSSRSDLDVCNHFITKTRIRRHSPGEKSATSRKSPSSRRSRPYSHSPARSSIASNQDRAGNLTDSRRNKDPLQRTLRLISQAA